MPQNLSSDYQDIPPRCPPYNYDEPSLPFTAEEIVAIDSIKTFLSDSELTQARKLETVYYSPVFKKAGGIFIPGLRAYETSFCFYISRFSNIYYEKMLNEFLSAVYEKCPKERLGGVSFPWFRITLPNGHRYYPLEFHGDLQAWMDAMIETATENAATLAWFDKGKLCLTDGRQMSFGEVSIERLEGGKPIPDDW